MAINATWPPTSPFLNQGTQVQSGSVHNPWWILALFGQIPALILYAVLLALVTSGIALGFAAMFVDWRKVRDADLPSVGGLISCSSWGAFLW